MTNMQAPVYPQWRPRMGNLGRSFESAAREAH
jgi:hypothetical protein